MFEYLQGKFIEANPPFAVLDIQGIGYKIQIPDPVFSKLDAGREIKFYISQVIREDMHTLYGFLLKQEKELFEKLLSLSGIGPKTALSLITHIPLSQWVEGIERKDLALFTKVPGIGKKTAERLILELRGKTLVKGFISQEGSSHKKLEDALSALMNLGFSQMSAQAALEKTMKKLSLDSELSEIISFALKNGT